MMLKFVLIVLLFSAKISAQNYVQKIFPSDPNPGVFFGRFVSLNSEFAFISSYQDFENGSSSGALYIFKKNDKQYLQISKLFPDDGDVEEYFGYSLASYKDWVITGAHHDSDFGASSGGAYIIHNNNNSWDFYQKLLPPDPAEADEFGKTVDIYDDFAVACSYLDDDNGTNSGSVYIFKLIDNKWEYFSKIQAKNPIKYAQFGLGLDLYKDKLIIGAPFNNENGKNSGAAYIFEFINDNWIETAKLIPVDISPNDEYGITVKIKDNIAFISSIKDDDKGENSGSVYVYNKLNDEWTFSQKITAPDGDIRDAFGIDLDFNDSLLVIGSYFDDDKGTNSGSIYFYNYTNNSWQFIDKYQPSDGNESDAFGASISLNNNDLLVGAYSNDDNGFFSGAAYYFSIDKLLTTNINTDYYQTPLVYPIPFHNTLNIYANSGKQSKKIEIYNSSGNIIYRKNHNGNTVSINLSNTKAGIYFIKIIENDYVYLSKIIKY